MARGLPGEALALGLDGAALVALSRHEDALVPLGRAVELDRQIVEALTTQGYLLMDDGAGGLVVMPGKPGDLDRYRRDLATCLVDRSEALLALRLFAGTAGRPRHHRVRRA